MIHRGRLDGVMLDAARHVKPAAGTELGFVPVEDLAAPLEVPEKCLRSMPVEQRARTREAIRRSRSEPPTPGLAIFRGGQLVQSWRTEDVLAGQAFALSGGTFKLRAARRGAPVRYTGMRTIRLNPRP